ncbi:TRAP transporter small permease [Acidisphaera sp. L21]|uniref:TRAP transporter small permease n=1 Tax=Acidisphaera sp. L21 TaxID=1641851 RepID=UPI00131C3E1A|nr:TRAP transporter small permease [Acidisphaera sp. L21]
MVRIFDRALEAVACTLLFVLLVTVLLGVITRATGEPLIWTDEGARFVMVWLASFGWMIAGRRRAHVRIRYFQDLLPPALHRGTEVVIQLAMVALGCALAWYGVYLVRRNQDLEATSLPISMAWLYIPMIPAGLLMAVQGVAQAIERGKLVSTSPLSEELVE